MFDALVFFFGAYFMFENTTVTSNGQVRAGWATATGLQVLGVKLGTARGVGVWVSDADGADPMAGPC